MSHIIFDPNTLSPADSDLARLVPSLQLVVILDDNDHLVDQHNRNHAWATCVREVGHVVQFRCDSQDLMSDAVLAVRNHLERNASTSASAREATRVIDVWDEAEECWWRFVRDDLRKIDSPEERERLRVAASRFWESVNTGDGLERENAEAVIGGMTDEELLEYYEEFIDVDDEDDEDAAACYSDSQT
jgi:hypothetical protein